MTEDDIESLTELELAAVSEDRRFPLCATGEWTASVPLIVVATSYLRSASPALPTGDTWVLDDITDESLVRSNCWVQDIELRVLES